jgi:NTE family protein
MPNGGDRSSPVCAVVLSGGGARGAYEIGVLRELLPVLQQRGERISIIVGASIGAVNAAFLAAHAGDASTSEATDKGIELWRSLRFTDVAGSLFAPSGLTRTVRYVLQAAGVPGARLTGLLDPAPMAATLPRRVGLGQIEDNVTTGKLRAVAVVATSNRTGRSVVFHRSGECPPRDRRRRIDYVRVDRLGGEHVLASAALPVMFPAAYVPEPTDARGWYFDGGTRLNTPVKPALELGADKVIVIALNPAGDGADDSGEERQPDVFDELSQLAQGLFADQIANDVHELARRNTLKEQGEGDGKLVPYIFVSPKDRDAVGRVAVEVLRKSYRGPRGWLRSANLAFLGRLLCVGSEDRHGDLLSYVFFAPEFADALIEIGRDDARAWLHDHADDPWRTDPLVEQPEQGDRARSSSPTYRA